MRDVVCGCKTAFHHITGRVGGTNLLSARPQERPRTIPDITTDKCTERNCAMKILWDISQLSGISNVKPETIYNWRCKSRIPYIKLRRLVRFGPDDIEQWLDDNKHSVSTKNHNLLIVDFAPMFVIILHVIKTRRNR